MRINTNTIFIIGLRGVQFLCLYWITVPGSLHELGSLHVFGECSYVFTGNHVWVYRICGSATICSMAPMT